MEALRQIPAHLFQNPRDHTAVLFIPSREIGINSKGEIFRRSQYEGTESQVNAIAGRIFSTPVEVSVANRLVQLKEKQDWSTEEKQFIKTTVERFFLRPLIEEVEQKIASMFPDNTIVNSQDEGHVGRSGDRIYFVKDANGAIIKIAKALITHRRNMQFETQLRGINTLLKLHLEGTQPIECLDTYSSDTYHLMILTPAKGQVQEQLFRQLETNPSVIDLLKRNFIQVGRIYARLHAYQQQPITTVSSEYYAESSSVWKDCQDLLKKTPLFADINLDHIDHCLEEIYKRFENHPGNNSYTHGDPHPGNWFVDNDGITLIDLGHLGPNGHPAYELHGAHSCLAYHSFLYGIDPKKTQTLQESFSEGYFSIAPKEYTTKEADCYFRFFWGVYNLRDRLQKDPVKYENYIRNMLNEINAAV
jgi:Ser/Thr protein kinase RdoA (MazF antagonist)